MATLMISLRRDLTVYLLLHLIQGDSAVITNVKPVWSCGDIKQLVASNGSEIKMLDGQKKCPVITSTSAVAEIKKSVRKTRYPATDRMVARKETENLFSAPTNLRECINNFTDPTPYPFAATSTSSMFPIFNHQSRVVPLSRDEICGELRCKEEASFVCRVVGWRDCTTGVQHTILEHQRDLVLEQKAVKEDKLKDRRNSKLLNVQKRTSLQQSTKTEKVDIACISNLEIHCVNEESNMGLILDYRVPSLLLPHLQATWMVPGSLIMVTLGLISQIDVVNDLLRMSRSDHTIVSPLDDSSEQAGDPVKETEIVNVDLQSKLISERRVGKKTLTSKERRVSISDSKRKSGASLYMQDAIIDGSRFVVLENERRRYEALCSNKASFYTVGGNGSGSESCARYRINNAAVTVSVTLPQSFREPVSFGCSACPIIGPDHDRPFRPLPIQVTATEAVNEVEDGSRNITSPCDSQMLTKKQKLSSENGVRDPLSTKTTGGTESAFGPSTFLSISVSKNLKTEVMVIEFCRLPTEIQAALSMQIVSDNISVTGACTAQVHGDTGLFDIVYSEIWDLNSDHHNPKGDPILHPVITKSALDADVMSPKASSSSSSSDNNENDNVNSPRNPMGEACVKMPRWRVIWMKKKLLENQV